MRPLTLLLLLPAVAFAQPKDKPSPLDKIDGYKRHVIEGFTLLVSDDVAKADVSKFERKPMEVLELELKMLVKIMTAKQLDALRNLPVWVEWEEQFEMTNGREGNATAVYYGGHQGHMLQKGKHPLKAKTVTILQMKALTGEHQPKTDSGRCVILHEFAHAVHDQLLGNDNASVKAAYTQAMERKLYDKKQYVSTNEAEFFAELTCAYFDQLHHHPKTRDDLKKHDPVTHKLMEAVWGKERKGEPVGEGKGRGPRADTGEGTFDLKVTPADLQFGESLTADKLKPTDLKGKVAVVGFFGGSENPVLGKLADLHRELSPYGLTVVAGSSFVATEDELKKELAARQATFPAVTAVFVRDKESGTQFTSRKPAHTLVFDPDGTCVFRGSGYDAAPHVRAAVGRQVVSKAVSGDTPKSLKPITDALVGGQPLLDVLPKLYPLALSSDKAVAAPAKELLGTLTRPGQEALDEAKKLQKADPLGAFVLLEGHAGKYKGTPVGDKIAESIGSLKLNDAVAAELKARAAFEPIKKLDTALMAQAGAFDPKADSFQQKNGRAILELLTAVEQMKKKHPKAKATEQAAELAKKYGK
jgi:hypothetical protein